MILMARRLVESGVRFVSMVYGGWDHHDRIHQQDGFERFSAPASRPSPSRGSSATSMTVGSSIQHTSSW